MFTRLIFFCLAMSGISSVALAYEHQYPPYQKGRMPQACKIHEIKPVKRKSLIHYSVADQAIKLNISLQKHMDDKAYGLFAALMGVTANGKKQLLQPYAWVGLSPKHVEKVYWSYLNQDNKKDLILNTRFAGNGKMNDFQITTFYLSTPKGYGVKQLLSYHLEPADFLDYTNDNKCEYLHLSYIYGLDEQPDKGKNYNYWNYNILRFVGGDIQIQNRLSRYFPKWITDIGRYNDQATQWLPKKTQQRLWQRHAKDLGGLVASPDSLEACKKLPNQTSGC